MRPRLKTEQSEEKQKFHKETKTVSADGSAGEMLGARGPELGTSAAVGNAGSAQMCL